jgi:hypothetical protein
MLLGLGLCRRFGARLSGFPWRLLDFLPGSAAQKSLFCRKTEGLALCSQGREDPGSGLRSIEVVRFHFQGGVAVVTGAAAAAPVD